MTNFTISGSRRHARWLLLVNLFALSSRAQEVTPTEIPHVYVVDFSVTGSNPHYAELSTFAPELVRLQLVQVPMLEVVRTPVAPPCGDTNRSTQVPSEAAQNAAQTQSAPNVPTHAPSDFYLITGSVAFRTADIQVYGALEHCVEKKLLPVTSDQEVFVPARALEQITVLTQVLVYKLEGLLPATRVRVASITAQEQKLEPIAAELTEQIKLEMTQHPGFQLSETGDADAVIDGQLFGQADSLKMGYTIHWQQQLSTFAPVVTVQGKTDDVPGFLRKTGESVYDNLSSQIVARQTGLKESLENSPVEQLLAEGKRLLCVDQAPTCQQDPQGALRLLSVAAGRSKNGNAEMLYLLALAQSAAFKYEDSIVTLQRALAISESQNSPEVSIEVLNQLGFTYNQLGDTQNAAKYYAESLGRNPNQPDLYIRQADILFETKPVAAVKALLEGLRHEPKSEPLHDSLQSRIAKLKEGDVKAVADLIESAMANVPLSEEYAQVCAYGASITIYSDRNIATQYLERIKRIPLANLSAMSRNWISRLRATDALQQQSYQAAYRYASEAQRVVDKENYHDGRMSNVLLSHIQFAWAQSLNEQDPARRQMLMLAHDRSKPIVQEGDGQGYSDFVQINHLLDNDAESKQIFSELLDKKANDQVAAEAVIYVCNEFLRDPGCAYDIARHSLTVPSDNVTLQLDGVEAALLWNDTDRALEWLTVAEQHPEADVVTKAVAATYRFWISYAGDKPSSRRDFENLVAAMNEYYRIWLAETPDVRAYEAWSFKGPRRVLTENRLPAATRLSDRKRRVLLDIFDLLEHPEDGMAHLTQLAEMM
jgi:hypothetical protein